MELYTAGSRRQTYTSLQYLAVLAAIPVLCTIAESPLQILLESMLASLLESLLESVLERASHWAE